ncbi:MAG: UDP-N-acetylglucosamine 1-carboxyvinyltransferase [Oscillospiraceae bacterium]|nr:UDP-N-acetylglucosamine 1-carboxyvinyltransferase [Oscillospiraceae bacterium]
MPVLNITGGPVSGTIRAHGAKNSILPILAATLLNRDVSVITNCPDLADVRSSLKILRHLGCKAEYADGTVTVDSSGVTRADIPEALMREMRSSVIFLGAVLARTGRADMSRPGGCELGTRPIDLHLAALKSMGAELSENGSDISCRASRLTGTEIILSFPSVGATENIMIAACAADGVTTVKNAAREPEIEDLQAYLRAMGADVTGGGTSTVCINGCMDKLRGAEHRVMPDRIETATYLCAAAMAGGRVTVEDAVPEHNSAVLSALSEAGCEISARRGAISLKRYKPLRPVRPVRTMPYPGFPTDAQSPLMSVCTRAGGVTVFTENIFESRFRHVGELARMGADIRIEGRVAVVFGVNKLYGARVKCEDLRGGAALVVAALGTEGVTTISHLTHIDRGYANLTENLTALGVNITRTP